MSKGYIAKRAARDSLKNNWGKAVTVFMSVCAVWLLIALAEQIVRLLINVPPTATSLSDTGEEIIITNTSIYSTLMTAAGALFFLVFLMPLTLGQYFWHYSNSKGSDSRVSSVFSPFSSFKNLAKSLWYFINISFRRLLWFFVFFFPASVLLTLIKTLLSEVETQYSKYLILGFDLLTAALLILSLTLYTIFSMCYFLAPYLLVSDPTLSVNKAIRISTMMMRSRKVEAFWFVLSFFGWFLLCIFVLPLLYVFPFYANARAHYARHIVENSYTPVKNLSDLAFTREFPAQEYQTI